MLLFFFFNDTATTEIYTLSLHDALPILPPLQTGAPLPPGTTTAAPRSGLPWEHRQDRGFFNAFIETLARSEEHTSELQSQSNLVCRLLLEKKKKRIK